MKTQQIIILGTLILAACVVSFIPFSSDLRFVSEGIESDGEEDESNELATIEGFYDKDGNYHPGSGNGNAKTTGGGYTNDDYKANGTIGTNGDYLAAVNSIMGTKTDPAADKLAIYSIQGRISSLNTQNSATLLGEIGNPNNLTNPRLFLQYMNWFGSNCPVDSNTCPGLGTK